MKKTLLLLLLFLSFSVNAQTPLQPPPMHYCDTDNDGFGQFDLASRIPAILNGMNPATTAVSFHQTQLGSQTNANPIVNTVNYTNTVAFSQTIYVRVFDTTNGNVYNLLFDLIVASLPNGIISGTSTVCQNSANPVITFTAINGTAPYIFTYLDPNNVPHTISTASGSSSATLSVSSAITGTHTYTLVSVQSGGVGTCTQNVSGTVAITVLPQPIANPATLTFCDPTELPIFNLNAADLQVTGGAPGVTVSYHETMQDAQLNANPRGPTYAPLVPGTQVLIARVTSSPIGCVSFTTLTLIRDCVQCQDSAPLNLTATNITDISLTLNWQNTFGMGNQASLIAVMPYGTAPSEVNAITVTSIQSSYTITSLQSEGCYSIYIKGFCGSLGYSNWSEPLNVCMPNCTNAGTCAEGFVLNAFLDSNNNGVKDNGEINFDAGNFIYQINESGNNLYGNSNNGTYYIFDPVATNSYDISFSVNSELSAYYSSPITHNNISLPWGSGLNYLSFPIVNATPHTDAQVNLYSSSGAPRPGFTYQVTIYYKNNGVLPIDGTVAFIKHPSISIASISQAGTSLTTDGFIYNFTNLPAFAVRSIVVTLSVPVMPTVNIGDLIPLSATIQTNNDVVLSNNSTSLTQTVVGSYDPNDKMESHGGKIIQADFTATDYLYYTIRFENTGTASAEFIRVEDLLDSQLDETTFEMISASHMVNTKREGSQLVWHFYDVDLPPTITNPNGSHGYVHFRIKPKTGYAIGDVIPNFASIYFDYNPAIVTDTFNTEFVQRLKNSSFDFSTVSLYPNPTSTEFTVTNYGTEKISKLTIYEITGKKIYSVNDNSNENIRIDVSQFAKGIYLIELISENNSKVTKKLVLK